MAPETPPAGEASTTSTETPNVEETPGAQGQQTPTPGEGAPEGTPASNDDGKLPDDHPLVKALAKEKQKSSSQATELAEARANSAKATKLEEELAARPTTEAMVTLQTRYDRLEAFLIAAGGPLGRALDSRTFTKDLFESDKDVADLVTDWHKANPSATAQALAGGAGDQGKKAAGLNDLIRAAASGSK